MEKKEKNLRIRTKDAAYQKLEVLASNRNKRYKYYEFLVEGVRNLNEAKKNGWQFSSLIYGPAAQLSDWAKDMIRTTKTDCNIELSAPLLAELSEKEDTSELMAVVKMRADDVNQIRIRRKAPLIAVFDRPSNKGNLGTLIRTLDSLGADGLIVTGHGVDLYDREVIGATMGSFFALPAVRIPKHSDLLAYMDQLREAYGDLSVIGTTAHAEKAVWEADLTRPLILMIGCETDGLSDGLRQYCTEMVTIPMAEGCAATSFNVACAATVMFYEAVRQRTALL
ncbi:MAG: rRNA methyltransferase [Clostridia bacterium]|nr:rRNA methyltransferase [Clostridia bacterium]